MKPTLVVAAVVEELGSLPGLAVGVGVVRAAEATARLCARFQPERVILVGSCGKYGASPDIGTAIQARMVGLVDGAAALGLAYAPLAPEPIATPVLLGLDLPTAKVATTGAITTDPTLAARLAADWDIEHLEAFGAALACQMVGVPFHAILGVANTVGPEAHAEWRTHRHDAEAAAQRAVEVWRNQQGGRFLAVG